MDLPPALTLDQLRNAVQAKTVDTVVLALTDMQGRLQGKRLTAPYFLDAVLEHGSEACNYLLAVDVEMNTVDGYAMSSWERGYGDFELKPDLGTLRLTPWNEGTALCLADLAWADGAPVVASPRQILRAQLDRLRERGLEAFAGTELEFIVFRDTYEEAFAKGYRGPRAGQPLQRRLLGPRQHPRGAAAAQDPQPDGRARAWRSRAPRASATTASTRSTSTTGRRCGPPTSTRSTRPARRRSPPPRAWRSRSWPSTTSARGRHATSTSRCGVTAPPRSRTTRRCSAASSRASSPACAS